MIKVIWEGCKYQRSFVDSAISVIRLFESFGVGKCAAAFKYHISDSDIHDINNTIQLTFDLM